MRQAELQLDLPLGGTLPDPSGQCSLQFDEQPLPFRLRRSQRANVSLRVDEQGLQVNAPRGMTLPQIEQAIRAGSRAIVGKLAEKSAGKSRLPLPARWQDGVPLPFLGREIVLCLDGNRDGIVLCGDRLHLPLPPQAGEKQIRDSVQGWLQAQARLAIAAQLEEACRRLDVPLPAWRLSFAAGAWGGIDANGCLRFSWRLVHVSPKEIGSVAGRFLSQFRSIGPAAELWEDDAAPVPA